MIEVKASFFLDHIRERLSSAVQPRNTYSPNTGSVRSCLELRVLSCRVLVDSWGIVYHRHWRVWSAYGFACLCRERLASNWGHCCEEFCGVCNDLTTGTNDLAPSARCADERICAHTYVVTYVHSWFTLVLSAFQSHPWILSQPSAYLNVFLLTLNMLTLVLSAFHHIHRF